MCVAGDQGRATEARRRWWGGARNAKRGSRNAAPAPSGKSAGTNKRQELPAPSKKVVDDFVNDRQWGSGVPKVQSEGVAKVKSEGGAKGAGSKHTKRSISVQNLKSLAGGSSDGASPPGNQGLGGNVPVKGLRR